MAIKSFKSIVNSMSQYLRNLRPNVDTKPGTFVRDVVIDPVANEIESFYIDLEAISNSQSPDLASVTDIENLGRNFGLYRKLPTKATGNVTFYAFSAPTTAITISQGTVVSSKAFSDGSTQQFTTTQQVTLSATNFNPNTGRYEVSAPVRANLAGTSANVPAGAISAIVSSLAGVSGVYNVSAFTSGTDYESISAFRERIKQILLGNNIGTSSGYYSALIAYPSVVDVAVSTPSSVLAEFSRTDIGSIDIYIRGLVSTQVIGETYVIPNLSSPEFVVLNQPLDLLASSSFSLVGSVTGTLISGVHYTIVQDASKVAGSIQARDKFSFLNVGTPSNIQIGEVITVTYSYNSLIGILQNYMEDPSRKVLGSNLLIKAAKPRQIDITCTVSVDAGITNATVTTNIVNDLTTKLNSYTIGEQVQQSDILSVITAATGVDDVSVPLTVFEENSTTGTLEQNSSGNITIPENSYATVGTITVVIR